MRNPAAVRRAIRGCRPRCRPTGVMMNDAARLPADFADLAPFADWALDAWREHHEKRLASWRRSACRPCNVSRLGNDGS